MNDRTYPTRPQLQLILDQGQFDRQVDGVNRFGKILRNLGGYFFKWRMSPGFLDLEALPLKILENFLRDNNAGSFIFANFFHVSGTFFWCTEIEIFIIRIIVLWFFFIFAFFWFKIVGNSQKYKQISVFNFGAILTQNNK